jgi:hypothetical protein
MQNPFVISHKKLKSMRQTDSLITNRGYSCNYALSNYTTRRPPHSRETVHLKEIINQNIALLPLPLVLTYFVVCRLREAGPFRTTGYRSIAHMSQIYCRIITIMIRIRCRRLVPLISTNSRFNAKNLPFALFNWELRHFIITAWGVGYVLLAEVCFRLQRHL